jgi:hypothetical protein
MSSVDDQHVWSLPEQLQDSRDVDRPNGIALRAVQKVGGRL